MELFCLDLHQFSKINEACPDRLKLIETQLRLPATETENLKTKPC